MTDLAQPADSDRYPGWFVAFLADRATRKPSAHTMKAYRQDFDAIAPLLSADKDIQALSPGILVKATVRAAFAKYAKTHEPASIRRCWSTWNTLCTYMFTEDLILGNPMAAVGRPKMDKTLPKAFKADAVSALLASQAAESAADGPPGNRKSWPERDSALVLTTLLTGMRADELLRTNIGDIRPTAGGGAIFHVRGKANKDRRIPVEMALITVIEQYLATRAARFGGRKRPGLDAELAAWPAKAPLFVGHDGERITMGTLQYRILRAYRRAGIESQRERGALVHGLRHTYATALADENVSVYTLMHLLGHESMATAQRYVSGAGRDTRSAAAQNPVYRMLENSGGDAAGEQHSLALNLLNPIQAEPE